MDSEKTRQLLDEWAASNGYEISVRWSQPSIEGTQVWATLTDGEAGAEMRLAVDEKGDVSVIDSDSRLQDDFPSEVLFLGGLSCSTNPSEVPGVPASPKVPDDYSTQQSLAFVANTFIGHLSSKQAPCTSGGLLACAWAVNHVVMVALGRNLGPTAEMLSTRNMFVALKRVGKEVSWHDVEAGDIVISPTQGKNIGHVGIFIDHERICSNSSAAAMWKQNFSKGSWRDRYGDRKGLPVTAFRM